MTVDMSMAAPPMVERVELRMDSSQYVQEASRAERATTGLIRTVDTLIQRVDGLTTRTGRGMQAVGLGAAAGITGATAVAARYQQQLSPVEASQQMRGQPVGEVSTEVDRLARSLPVARAELASMAQILSDLGETTPERIGEITEQVTRLSAVTGETIPGLARQFAEYQRTAGRVQDPSRFASSLAYVSRERGVSAGGTLQFAEAISPLSKPAGLDNQEVLGISAAFQAAGADGFRAANAFNRVLSDIVRLAQEGSPELSKFANIAGVTAEEFSKMDRAEAIVRVFEGIGDQGPEAIRTLDKLGLDGVRTATSIQAVANQQGGLRAAIADAGIGANNEDLFQDASTEALSGLNDELAKTKNLLEESAKTIGDSFLGGFETAAKAANGLLTVVNDIVKALATPLAIGGGALALGGLAGGTALAGYKGITTAAAGLWAANSTPVRGAIGAFREGRDYARTGVPQAGGYVSRINNNEIQGWRRGVVERSLGLGMLTVGERGGDFGDMTPMERRASRMRTVASQVGRIPVRGMNWWFGGIADAARVSDVAGVDRPSLFRQDGGERTTFGQRLRGAAEWQRQMRAEGPQLVKAMMSGDTKKVDELTKAVKGNVEEAKKLTQSQGSLRRDLGTLGRSFTSAGYQSARAVGSTAMGIGRGVAGALGPMAAVAGGALLYNEARTAAQESGAVAEWQGNPLAAMREELGLAVSALGSFTDSVTTARDALPVPEDTGTFTPLEAAYARATQNEIINPGVSGLTNASQAAAFLAAYGPTQPEPEAQQGLRIDVARRLGESPTRTAIGQAGNMTQMEGLAGLVESFAELPSSFGGLKRWFAAQGPLGPLPLMGPLSFTEEDRDRLNLSTGLVNQIRDTELATGGSRAANQAALPGILTILEETGKAQVNGVTDAVVENLVQSELLPGGFRGTTFQAAFDTSGGDVVDAFLTTLQKGGSEAQEFARYLEEGGFVISTSMSQIEDQLRKFRAQDAATARYGQLEGNALYEKATFGGETVQSPVSEALASPGDPTAVFIAWNDLARDSLLLGGSFNAADAQLQELQAAINDSSDDLYQLAGAARQAIAAERERSIVTQGREGRINTRAGVLEQQLNIPVDQRGPEFAQDTQRAFDQFKAEEENYRQFLVSLRAAQDNFDVQQARVAEDSGIQRARAIEDFGIQQAQAQEDYFVSTERAEEQHERTLARTREDFRISQARSASDFRLSQRRAEEDYQRSRVRAVQDFQRQTMRAQQDFARQMQRTNEDLAKSFYDPFQRAGAQYTYGAGSLIVNLERQNELIAQQVKDVERLKQAGLSDAAVQQLDLLNPNNRQQAGRLAANVATDPSLVKDFNATIKDRLDLAEGVTFNESNDTYKRARQDFNRAQKRASEDFLRAQARSASDFRRQLDRSVQDFTRQTARAVEDNRRSVARMAEDFRIASAQAEEDFLRAAARAEDAHQRALDRMSADVARALTRAKEDLVRLAKEYTGTIRQLAQQTTEWLRDKLPGMSDQVVAQIDRVDRRVAELNRKYSSLFKSQSENAREYLEVLQRLESQEVTRFTNRVNAGGGSGGRNSDGQMGGHLSASGAIMKAGTYRYERGPAGHGYNAVDLAADAGTPIYAPWAGSAASSWDNMFGWYTTVTAGGLRFLAAHQRTRGKSGSVRTGEQIGVVGSTGNSTGPHLHAEVFRVGTARDAGGSREGLLNPATYLKYDTGGVLEHGMGAINLSRKPEAILTNDQWRIIDRLGDGLERARHLGDPAELVTSAAAKMTVTRPMAAPVVTHNTWVDQSMHINGPMAFHDPRNARELADDLAQHKRKRQLVRGKGYG